MIEPGIYPDMPHAEYHALEGYVSNSYLSRLDACPAAGKVKQEETDAMTFGRAFHCFVLDGMTVFSRDVAVLPPMNLRKNDGKAEYAAFCDVHQGKAIITEADLSTIVEMDKSVKAHPLARNLIGTGTNEVSIFWEDSFSGLPCKARPDKDAGQSTLVDLKKTRDASLRGFQRSILSFGYHRQAAFYLDGMTAVTGEDHNIFAFIAVEDKPPYRTEVYTLSQEFIEFGRVDYRRLITLENSCRARNEWPNYTNPGAIEIELPGYINHGREF